MNQETSRPTTSPAISKKASSSKAINAASSVTAPTKGLGQMAESMRTAVDEFKSLQPSGIMALALSAWKPLSTYGMRAFKFTSVYSRRHPVRMAISVIAIGYVASRLLKARSAAAEPLKESV